MIKTSKRFFISPRRAVSINNSIFARQYKSSMKPFVYIAIWVFLLIGIPACQRHTDYPPAMQQAEKLMDTRPDSALHQLQGMADTLTMLPDEAQMYYHLLTIQAKDKQYITHTSDSLINRIVSFYEDYGDKDRLMMAYFYQGSTYRDMNDAPRALKAFQQAVDLKVPNLDLLAKTYNQMGTLFMYQGLHDEVIRVNRKSIELYLLQGKRNKISYAQRDIARMYHIKRQKDSTFFYYQKACNTALKAKDSIRYYDILGELGTVYYQMDSFQTAKRIFMTTLSHRAECEYSNLFPYLGYIYEKESAWDSAYYYYHKTLRYGNIRQKYYAYLNLFHLTNTQGNTIKANEYIKEALLLKNTLEQNQQTEAIAKINSLYNYQHTEQENYSLKIKQSQHKEWLMSLVYLILLLTMLCILCFLYIKRKESEKESLKQKLAQIDKEIHNQSTSAIQENKQEIENLEKQLKEKQYNTLESKLIEVQKERLNLKNRDIQHLQEEQELRVNLLKESSIYQRFHWASNDTTIKITHEDWINLKKEIDKAYPNFIKRLYNLNPDFSIQGIQICCLTKISMPPAAISRVIGRSRGAITLACRRYYEKIHQSEGNAEMFRAFIAQL